jgi:hypothetical protein
MFHPIIYFGRLCSPSPPLSPISQLLLVMSTTRQVHYFSINVILSCSERLLDIPAQMKLWTTLRSLSWLLLQPEATCFLAFTSSWPVEDALLLSIAELVLLMVLSGHGAKGSCTNAASTALQDT